MQEKSDFSHFFMCDVSPFRLCLMYAFAQKMRTWNYQMRILPLSDQL